MLLKNGIPLGYVFGKIKFEIVFIALYGALIAVLCEFFPGLRVSIPIAVPAVLGTVISLLLGFRSNQAYDRWWEARHIWGAVVNDSRTLGRQLLTFVQGNYDNGRARIITERMIRRQSAWAYSLGQHLRGQNASKGLEKYISYEEYEFVQHYSVVPAALLELQARDMAILLEEGWVNAYQQVELDRTISRLCESMGKCERIKNTVFPSTYSLYIHFSLLLFIGLLPFSLVEYFGHAGIPVMIAIASSFLLIEKMAIHLQDPFENKPTDTPMTTIARNIERDLFQMLRERPVSEHIAAGTFYVL